MGDLISRIEEDYEDYVNFCKQMGEKPVTLGPGFYDHADELAAEYGYKRTRSGYLKL